MKQETLLEVLNNKKKGQFIRLSYRSDLDKQVKAAAKVLYSVEKVSVGTFKYGCDLRRVNAIKNEKLQGRRLNGKSSNGLVGSFRRCSKSTLRRKGYIFH